ncbi:MAG: sigma factor-like helix-turn-helix DNA-binding protein [Ilumatobacteraceae bacterium]
MSSIDQPTRVEDGSVLDTVGTFDDFYRVRYQRAVRLAVVLTGSAAGAEDVVQDVMADAHQMWARISRYDDPSAWLRRAIVNRAISRRRRATVAAKGLLKLKSEAKLSLDLVNSDWELWRHVGSLPTRQAQMIALVYVEGLTLESAAGVLGIGVPTAKSHLARAKQRLERDLSDWRST